MASSRSRNSVNEMLMSLTMEDLQDFKEAFELGIPSTLNLSSNSTEDHKPPTAGAYGRAGDPHGLEPTDLRNLSMMMGKPKPVDEISHALSQCKDKDGSIEFPTLIEKLSVFLEDIDPCTQQELRKAFKVIDGDNNGFVTVEEIQTMAKQVVRNVAPQEMEIMFREADSEGKGEIDIEQFINMMTKL